MAFRSLRTCTPLFLSSSTQPLRKRYSLEINQSRASNTPKLKGQRLIRKPPPASLSLSPAIAPTASFLSGSSEGCTPESVLFSGPWRLSSSTDFRRFYPPAFLWLVFLTFRTAVKLPQTVIRRIFLTKPYKFLPLILLQGKRPNLVWRFLGCHRQCEWFCTYCLHTRYGGHTIPA